jgi:hypothetical protein
MSRGFRNVVAAITLATFILVFFALATQMPLKTAVDEVILPSALAQATRKVFNVKDFGARGDNASDDTAAIQRTIQAAPDGSTIYFPPGIYNVGNFFVTNRSGLVFVGEERNSVIKQKTGAPRIATFDSSRDVVITKLAFDANGILKYGGVVFYASTGVRLEQNSFFDSAPKPIGSGDHYSFVFGKGPKPSRDVKIINNVIDDLQLEVDHSQNVIIEGNTVSRALNTAGIGIFTIGDNAVAEDYLIKGNTLIDPPKIGFAVELDPPSNNNCTFRRITIINNKIIRTKTGGRGILVGTPDNSKSTMGNVFEDITIKDNVMRVDATAPQPGAMIFANSSARAGITFQRLIVSGNTFENNGPANIGYAIDLRRLQNSVVADNTLKGATNGIALAGDLLANDVHNNVVEAADIAYRLDSSLGGNRAINNRVIGNPRLPWLLSNMKTSDAVER